MVVGPEDCCLQERKVRTKGDSEKNVREVEEWPGIGWLEMALERLCQFFECPKQAALTLPPVQNNLRLPLSSFFGIKRVEMHNEGSKLILRPLD